MGERRVSGDFVYVTSEKAMSLEPNLAWPGDIVFTQRGTLGQVCVVPEQPFDRYLKLEEIVVLLEEEGSLLDLFREKVRAAITDKNPLFEGHRPSSGASK